VTYVDRPGKSYQRAVREQLWEARAVYDSPNPVEVEMLVQFSPRFARISDLDNRVKPFLDALANGRLIRNDRQVRRLEVREGPPCDPPAVVCTVRERLFDPADALRWMYGSG